MKQVDVKITAIYAGVLVLAVATGYALQVTSGMSPFIPAISVLASLVTLGSFVHTQVVPRLRDKTAQPPRPFPPKWRSIIFLGVVTAAATPIMVIGTVNLLLVLAAGLPTSPPAAEYISLYIVVPLLVPTLLFLLYLKVRATRMLDVQKYYLRDLARTHERLALRDDDLARFEAEDGHTLPEAQQTAVSSMLNSACRTAVLIASSTGLGHVDEARAASVLFVADVPRKQFIPVAWFPAHSEEYSELLRTRVRPAFLDPRALALAYNRFRGTLSADGKSRNPIVSFREGVQGIASTCGAVYALERTLSFRNAYSKCLVTSFDFVRALKDHDQERFRFRQIVGIPICVMKRKVGVLLLFGTHNNTFYGSDRAYGIVGSMVGGALQIAMRLGYLHAFRLSGVLECAPVLDADEHLREPAVRVINSMRSDFSEPCWEDPTWQTSQESATAV